MSSQHDGQIKYLGFLAGAVAGLIGDGIVHPVDTIRTRLQAQKAVRYDGMVDVFRRTLRQEGVSAFYKGFGAVASMTMPAHALYFGGYEATKSVLQPNREEGEKSAWVHFTAGFVADVCGSIIWAPMDVIKQRVQMANKRGQLGTHAASGFENSFRAFRTILSTEGARGLYRGAAVAVATFGPYVGLYFSFYEHLKLKLSSLATQNLQNDSTIGNASKYAGKLAPNTVNMAINLGSAFVAASAAALITCPIDVVKTNMQVYSVQDGGSPNTIEAIKSLYRQGGLKTFLRGWNARILWLAPGSAVTMVAYEQCKLALSYITHTPQLLKEE